MRSLLLTTPLLLLALAGANSFAAKKDMQTSGVQIKKESGGITPSVPKNCSKSFTAKEHRSWAKNHLRSKKLPRKAHKKHLQFYSCAQNKKSARLMSSYWKKVKRSVLPRNHDLWIKIGRCEQPGSGYKGVRWSHPGPTYQGGLGFWYGTWDSFKYPRMPGNAGQATWRQQMKVANRLYKAYGTSPWGCA